MKTLTLFIILSFFACNFSGKPDENKLIHNTADNTKTMNTTTQTNLKISSSAFEEGGKIPSKYSCDGSNFNPPLKIKEFPTATQTFALILEDPDAPGGSFIHWLCWNIPPVEDISENSTAGIQGKNSTGKNSYSGPCPPAGKPHHYVFNIYALDIKLDLDKNSSRSELEKAMQGHIIAKGELTGLYSSSR
jgi:Raf kinase inhibitor-like YbhB/YbcL family protein